MKNTQLLKRYEALAKLPKIGWPKWKWHRHPVRLEGGCIYGSGWIAQEDASPHERLCLWRDWCATKLLAKGWTIRRDSSGTHIYSPGAQLVMRSDHDLALIEACKMAFGKET